MYCSSLPPDTGIPWLKVLNLLQGPVLTVTLIVTFQEGIGWKTHRPTDISGGHPPLGNWAGGRFDLIGNQIAYILNPNMFNQI